MKLQIELEAFLYFTATAAQIFTGLVSDLDWQQAENNGHIEALAEARQAFELNSMQELQDSGYRSCGRVVAFRLYKRRNTM